MRSTIIVAVLGLALLPATAIAQTNPQTAAVDSPTSANLPSGSPRAIAITREQYMQRVQEHAGQRAAARFDQMDTNHDGVLDRAEIRTWRSHHPRHARATSSQPAPQ